MIFIILLILATGSLATTAAFFSIYGLSQIFAASALSVIIMGSALEFSKLLAASFLHRFWKKINMFLKTYLFAAIIILMSITSIGIFGYLTSAYQSDSIPLDKIESQLSSDKRQLARALERKAQIDKQIAQLPNNYITARQRLQKSFKSEYDGLTKTINKMNVEIPKLESEQISTKAKIGPIMYVARVLHQDPNNSIFYLTILLMVVFDPLAVTLTIATNVAIEHYYKEKKNRNKSLGEVDSYSDLIEKNENNEILENESELTSQDSDDDFYSDIIQRSKNLPTA